jgi:hypothetical protein
MDATIKQPISISENPSEGIIISTLKMEAACSSETVASTYKSIWPYNPIKPTST